MCMCCRSYPEGMEEEDKERCCNPLGRSVTCGKQAPPTHEVQQFSPPLSRCIICMLGVTPTEDENPNLCHAAIAYLCIAMLEGLELSAASSMYVYIRIHTTKTYMRATSEYAGLCEIQQECYKGV